jgi:hypothetical protein
LPHTEAGEICLVQNDYDDSFNSARVSFLGVSAWPTVCGSGLSDCWPLTWLEADFQAHAAVPSPLTISITENGQGDFTAHIEAEEDVVDADFFMVATLDEYVPSASGMSHLPHHVKVYMTPPSSGEPFTLLMGESVDINKTFTVQPEWDYSDMGVAAWVSRPGGTNTSPCPYGDIGNKNEVLQSSWMAAGGTSVPEGVKAKFALSAPSPNPFSGKSRIAYSLPDNGRVTIQLYDVAGRHVAVLQDDVLPAGPHAVTWDGLDEGGHECAGGIYFVRMTFEDGQVASEKVVKLK